MSLSRRFRLPDCCSSTSCKNCTLVKYTFLYRLKLNRWIITGMANADNDHKNVGYKKCIKQMCELMRTAANNFVREA